MCDKSEFTEIEKQWLDMTNEQRAEYIPERGCWMMVKDEDGAKTKLGYVSKFDTGFTHFKASIQNENS